MKLMDKIFGTYSQRELKKITHIKDAVLALEEKFAALSEEELKAMTPKFKERLAAGETLDDILPEAFATCREASWRVLGMKHFPVQIIGGIVLHQGRIAEMRTGEGKTLVATLPAYLNALSGDGVHQVTVNDYLAKRDSEWMGKIYRYLGLTVGLVVAGMNPEQKKAAYAADITYGTNNEYGFDYLRDNMVSHKHQLVQRGFNFAIVDEVDSILVDEARTPLIISGQGDKSTDLYTKVNSFAKTLTCLRVKESDDKIHDDEVTDDYVVDEKARRATLSTQGAKKAEKHFGIENLTDPENSSLSHHINQAIKAHGVMQADIDYVVKDGEVIIVDEYTGRLMVGRRYNEGLHQAIEAKEGVKVARESKTLASVTFQNYFRMYKKLSGMTGTALTEEHEFREIYKLDVIVIPTNKPIQRLDEDDVVFKTEAGKLKVICDTVEEAHKTGQPVLVGTVSIEKSELISKLLKQRKIPHQVLNAKHHEREAEIVAQAGKFGSVTIATNMAGRGTDIVLGGNAEYLAKAELRKKGFSEGLIYEATGFADTTNPDIIAARETYSQIHDKYKAEIDVEAEKVKAAGGLFIIGTERHESRRIDNQLRGRAGRQGDVGRTRFFLSLQDDLMRLFGGDRLEGLMEMLKVDEDMPIEAKMLSGSIESSQSKVEGRNFGIRKSVLRFDDVMNKQREIIYKQRSQVLNGEDISAVIKKMMTDLVDKAVESHIGTTEKKSDWDIAGLHDMFKNWAMPATDLVYTDEQLQAITKEDIANTIKGRMEQMYNHREKVFGSQLMREIERIAMLRSVDSLWMDHIDAMEELKKGIYLRSYGQKDPVVEYTHEGFDMFDQMIESIKENTVKQTLTLQVRTQQTPQRPQSSKQNP